MSSYAALREMALKKKEEEQASLNRERERKEKEAAAKLAAREAAEREQKERERKILIQRMARQKEEEARERLRKEHAVQLNQEQIVDDQERTEAKGMDLKQVLTHTPKAKAKPAKVSGLTHKVDLSHRLKSGSSSGAASAKKRKKDEDDFVGNRFDKPGKDRTERASSSSSASKRKAVPMTREEKQAMKRAREFGAIPRLPTISRLNAGSGSSRSSPSVSAGAGESRLSERAQPTKENGLVALGAKKRDHRSIDEIERDLKRSKEQKGLGKSEGPSQAELEREAALARRQKAMEEKRRTDQEARERAALKKASDNDADDDLFGSASEDEPAFSRKSSPQKSGKAVERGSEANVPSSGLKKARPLSDTQPREPRPIASRSSGGINPADFLPGAPLRPEAIARLAQKGKASSPARGSPIPDALARTKRVPEARPSPTNAASAVPPAPPRRETARDRFIREQEDKKRAAAASASSKLPGFYNDGHGSEEEMYEDEYESEGYDDDDGGSGHNYRDEIWKMFGKDRKQYAARIVDSDDDMEADAASVLQEEMRSSRQAREEDLREEQLEKQREKEKMLRKQALKKAGRQVR